MVKTANVAHQIFEFDGILYHLIQFNRSQQDPHQSGRRPDPENGGFVRATAGPFCPDWIRPPLRFRKLVQAGGSSLFF